jgi:ribosome maturation factor RimP
LEKITPIIKNTAMRFGLVPVGIEFVKENHRWFLRQHSL